jgi:hypothetical protein
VRFASALSELVELDALDLVLRHALAHDGVSAEKVSGPRGERLVKRVRLRHDPDAPGQESDGRPGLGRLKIETEPGGHGAKAVELSVVVILRPRSDDDAGAAHTGNRELLGVSGEVVGSRHDDLVSGLPVHRTVEHQLGAARVQRLREPHPARAGVRRVDRSISRALLAKELKRAAEAHSQNFVAEEPLGGAAVVVLERLVLVEVIAHASGKRDFAAAVGVPDALGNAASRIGDAHDALAAITLARPGAEILPIQVNRDDAALGADGGAR